MSTIVSVSQNYSPFVAGVERTCQALAEGFERAGMDSIVATGGWKGTGTAVENGVSVHRLPVWSFGKRRFGGISLMVSLFAFLLTHRFDVLLVHQIGKLAFVSVIAAKLKRKTVIVVSHCGGDYGDAKLLRASGYGWMLPVIRWADCFVGVSDGVAEELRADKFPNVCRIYNRIVPWYTGERDYSRGNRLVTAARLDRQKGLDVLLSALARLKTSDWTLDIYGIGPEWERLGYMADDLGIGERVKFLGIERDMATLMADKDIFVLPSRAEGTGMALLEAMQGGLPVIATNVCGLKDIVTDGVNGLMVESEDAFELAFAIQRLMLDEGLRKRLGKAGKALVAERFSIEQSVVEYLDAMETLTEDK